MKAALGEDGLKEWRSRRGDARTIFVSTHDFPTLPNDKIDERLAALPTDIENAVPTPAGNLIPIAGA